MKLLDLFSGIGGFSLAAEWAGIETVAFCERDRFCKKILAKHWPAIPIVDDIHNLKGDEFGTVDIISGGFPCQPFSLAGKRSGTEDDRFLWPEMLRVIQGARPYWVLGENVPGIVSLALDDVLSDLEGIGYKAQTFIVPACAVDAPHRRDRVWIVANSGLQPAGNQKSGFGEKSINGYSKGKRSNARDIFTDGDKDVANTNGGRIEGSQVLCSRKSFIDNSGQTMADSNVFGRNGRSNNETGRVLSRRDAIARCRETGTTWEPEPCVGRVAYGVPSRVDRLKGLGNAIVPEVAFQFFQMIQQIERGKL